ncbi:MAG: hypothetical protein H6766_02415 [Candidatus Peribacteria bacterium]|nr:MAG: hypothetical protein H6766_02415 [Candidatus Peribacteria bacterium]
MYDRYDTSVTGYGIVELSSNSSFDDIDNFKVTADPDNADENEWVNITVEARDSRDRTVEDYNDSIKFKVYRRSSSSSSWSDITSREGDTGYFDISSTYRSSFDTSISFSSSWDGEKTFSNFIRFENDAYDYKVVVYDRYDTSVTGYGIVELSSNSSFDDIDNFKVTADPDNADENEWVNITVEARDSRDRTVEDYNDSIKFKVYRRSSSSSSWSDITSREGDTGYFDISSTYRSSFDTSISFSSSWDGEKTFSNFIRFENDAYDYKVVVYDRYDTSVTGYGIVELSSNSSFDDIDNFKVTADPDNADENEWVNITVEARDSRDRTVEDYNDSIKFKVYRRSSSSSSWSDITSREGDTGYFDISSTYRSSFDTSISFSSSWDGEKTFSNFIRFENDAYDYKVVVYDRYDTSVTGYGIVELVGNSSMSIDGYSSREFAAVERVYNRWPSFINDLERAYSILRWNSNWQNAQEEFYDNLRDVVNDEDDKEWEDYEEFYDALYSFVEYTVDLIND